MNHSLSHFAFSISFKAPCYTHFQNLFPWQPCVPLAKDALISSVLKPTLCCTFHMFKGDKNKAAIGPSNLREVIACCN